MKQGVLTNGRARLMLKAGSGCFRPRRKGERKRKSVRGCIVDSNLSVLNLIIVKKGKFVQLSVCFIHLLTAQIRDHLPNSFGQNFTDRLVDIFAHCIHEP